MSEFDEAVAQALACLKALDEGKPAPEIVITRDGAQISASWDKKLKTINAIQTAQEIESAEALGLYEYFKKKKAR